MHNLHSALVVEALHHYSSEVEDSAVAVKDPEEESRTMTLTRIDRTVLHCLVRDCGIFSASCESRHDGAHSCGRCSC